MLNRRLKEIIGLAMIGEGLLAVLDPAGHVELWRDGPKAWRKMMDPFARHPEVTRALGAGELVLGLWLATRQFETPARLSHLAGNVAARHTGGSMEARA